MAERTSLVGSTGAAEGSGAAGLEEDGKAIEPASLAPTTMAIAADAASPLPSPPSSPPPPSAAAEDVEEAAGTAELSPPRQPPPPRATAPSILARAEREKGGATRKKKKKKSDRCSRPKLHTQREKKGLQDEPVEKQRGSTAARADGHGHHLCRHGIEDAFSFR